MIQLDFHDRRLIDVVTALNERYDVALSLRLKPVERGQGILFEIADPDEPRQLAELREQAVTLVAHDPLPFWKAIDLLCDAANLRYGLAARRTLGNSQESYELFPALKKRGAVSDSGAFRVQVADALVSYHRETFFAHPSRIHSHRNLPLAVLPEPGLMLHQTGPVTVDEAIDDEGHPLATRPPTWPEPARASHFAQVANSWSSLCVAVEFTMPIQSGSVLRRIRGTVPVAVVSRAPKPLVVPLKSGAPVRPFRTNAVSGFVQGPSPTSGGRLSVKLTLNMVRGFPLDPLRPDFTEFQPERVMEHIEFYDASGRKLNYTRRGENTSIDGHSYELTIQPFGVDAPDSEHLPTGGPLAAPIPADLRYYEFKQTALEVPFDFRDLRVP